MRFGIATEKNRSRRTMEDTHFVGSEVFGKDSALLCVFDGHGGNGSSRLCAKKIPEKIIIELERSPNRSVSDILWMAIEEVDREIGELGMDSGTAAAIAVVKNGRLTVAGTGDSRVITDRPDGSAIRLTEDHKPVTALRERSRIYQKGGFVAQGRAFGVLGLSRAIGDTDLKPHVISAPCTGEMPLRSPSTIIVACDGLWDVCTDERALEIARSEMDPQMAAQNLVLYAIENGSDDNITVIIGHID